MLANHLLSQTSKRLIIKTSSFTRTKIHPTSAKVKKVITYSTVQIVVLTNFKNHIG